MVRDKGSLIYFFKRNTIFIKTEGICYRFSLGRNVEAGEGTVERCFAGRKKLNPEVKNKM